MAFYPNRGWEKAYRDLYRVDSQFTFLCAPNDTHNCLLKASVKSGVITRIDPSYEYGNATDLYGNCASHRWDPRACSKGLSLVRRFYGDRRVKGPMVRKGYLAWVQQGYPRDAATGTPPPEYFQRGKDEWLRVTWDEAFALVASAMQNIAGAYSGDQGQERLRQQGYDPALVEKQARAGTQVLKFRGGMPFLGVTRIFGLYRMANSLALLDSALRGVGPEQALGGRVWDSYTWHTDLPPGHPMVTGQQTVDFDLFAVENADLVTLWGMNWIATKMPDAHWLTEARLRGAKIVVISTDYQATANKADEVIILRPGTDAALALGIARLIIDEGSFDESYVKSSTDLPLLVRMDTLKKLQADCPSIRLYWSSHSWMFQWGRVSSTRDPDPAVPASGPRRVRACVITWTLKYSMWAGSSSLSMRISATSCRVRVGRSRVLLKAVHRRSYSGLDHPPRFSPLQRFAAVPTSALVQVRSPADKPPREAIAGNVWRSCRSRAWATGSTDGWTSNPARRHVSATITCMRSNSVPPVARKSGAKRSPVALRNNPSRPLVKPASPMSCSARRGS